jgi:hypothetical protein
MTSFFSDAFNDAIIPEAPAPITITLLIITIPSIKNIIAYKKI